MAPLSTNNMLRTFFPIALKIDEKSEKANNHSLELERVFLVRNIQSLINLLHHISEEAA